MLEMLAFMHIIGKISEGNPNYIYIQKINAIIGVLGNSLVVIKMVVQMNSNANIVMAGKNKNIIQIIIN